jgi:hypothetical protein
MIFGHMKRLHAVIDPCRKRDSVTPHKRLVCLIVAMLALFVAAAPRAAELTPAVGLWWTADDEPVIGSYPASSYVRIDAAYPAAGQVFDWAVYEAELERLHRAGKKIVVTLDNAPDLADPSAIDAWVEFSREAVRRGGPRLGTLQVGAQISSPEELTAYAFLLKTTTLAVRAEARAQGAAISILQAAIPADRLALQAELWTLDVAPYIDAIPLHLTEDVSGRALSKRLTEWTLATLKHPPAPRIWLIAAAGSAGQRAANSLEALSAGAAVGLVQAEQANPDLTAWIDRTHELVSQQYAPAPLGDVTLIDDAGEAIPDSRALLRLFNAENASTLVFYRAPGKRLESPTDRLLLADRAMNETEIVDLLNGEAERLGSGRVGSGRSVRVRRGEFPQAIRFVRPSGPLDLPPQVVETKGTREPTAEEILAEHRQVQRVQDDRLERYTARGRTDLHFTLAAGASPIDYSVEANYFWQRGQPLDWEETDYFINGNRLSWKKIPEIPLIQPEKVLTLPFDLTLDRTYVYRKVGKDLVDGRGAWILAFEPADPNAPLSLYRGRVWIDTETYARVKTSLVQTQLEPPVLSNEEVDLYADVSGPDGNSYRMLSKVDGQQVWNAAGRNFVVRRELTFWDVRINPPLAEFEDQRSQAYDGDNKMMRETDEGIRYLDLEEDGSRVVRTKPDASRLFLLGGLLKDQSSGVLPLAGVNYLNFNLWDRDIQLNAFMAGVVNFITFSDPAAFHRNWDVTANLGLSAIKGGDKVFTGDTELVLEQIDTRSQNLSFSLGIPLGKFVKVDIAGGGRYVEYFQDSSTRRTIDAYNMNPMNTPLRLVLPPDHFEYRNRLRLEVNRRGWSVEAFGSTFRRGEFGSFGLVEDVSGSPVRFDLASLSYVTTAVDPVQHRFSRFGLNVGKDMFLPKFQQMRFDANFFDGTDLDRFSRWQFSLLGDTRLNGFAGSGVRFDRGQIGRIGYSFNLLEVIRFDAVIESAWVREDASLLGTQNHGGVGIAANFVAPWKLAFQVSYGRALWSDIPELEGQNEFLVVALRLF